MSTAATVSSIVEALSGVVGKKNVHTDIETLKEKWIYFTEPSLFYTAPYMKHSSAGVASTLSIVDDKIFFGANDGNLYCLGIKEGEYIWSRNLGAPILSDVLIDANSMYVSDYAGNLYKYDISSVLKIKHDVGGVRSSRNVFYTAYD